MAEEKVLIDNQAVPLSETKTVVSFKAPSPFWAKAMFRSVFAVTKAIALWVGVSTVIGMQAKVEILLILPAIDMLAFGLSKAWGIKIKDDTEQ